jgi:hypothetical protein
MYSIENMRPTGTVTLAAILAMVGCAGQERAQHRSRAVDAGSDEVVLGDAAPAPATPKDAAIEPRPAEAAARAPDADAGSGQDARADMTAARDSQAATSEAGTDSSPAARHMFVMAYPNRIVDVMGGKVIWEHTTPSDGVMFSLLPNGNIFYPHGRPTPGAQEVDRNHKLIWSYTSKAQELVGGDWLPGGGAILGEGGPPAAVEVNGAGAVVRSMRVATSNTDAHGQIRHIRKLPNGNILAALEGENVVREYDSGGATVWEFKNVLEPFDALRLANGHTLIGGGASKRVIDVDAQGKISWEFNDKNAPDLGLTWICSVQVLQSGNLLVANWLGGGGGTGVHAFEVTRDKRVVWKLDDHNLFKSVTTVIAVGE